MIAGNCQTCYHCDSVFNAVNMTVLLTVLGLLGLAFILGPRPQLKASYKKNPMPEMPIERLAGWLQDRESRVPDLISGAGAHICWAKTSQPSKTRLSFLYLHGFSATWPETAPVTQRLADHFQSNVVQGRIAGHGTGPDGMLATAEEWLQSIGELFELAQRIGDKVVIVATSTGAPLSVWLALQPELADKLHACLFMSPNFRVRSRLGFLLTWPWSKYWIQIILGKEIQSEPKSEAEANCWTQRYSTLALIEMQKTLDWANHQDFTNIHIPMAMMYMENDATVYPPAAINVFNLWRSELKYLYRVTIDGDAPEHVFVGDITAPHRTDWCVKMFIEFLEKVDSDPRK